MSSEIISLWDREETPLLSITINSSGAPLLLQQYPSSDDRWGIYSCLWDGGIGMLAYLHAYPLPNNSLILDLGSGTGMVGIGIAIASTHLEQVAKVIITDLPEALPLMEQNVSLNHAVTGSTISVEPLIWGTTSLSDKLFKQLSTHNHPVYILGADIIYRQNLFVPLLNTMALIWSACPTAKCIFATQSTRQHLEEFYNKTRQDYDMSIDFVANVIVPEGCTSCLDATVEPSSLPKQDKECINILQITSNKQNIPPLPGLCCFFLKYNKCIPPRPPCRFLHAPDDGVTPCCFGATCRLGHKKRSASPNCPQLFTKQYWKDWNHQHAGRILGDSPACRDATLLRSQLEPWPTAMLRNRLVTEFGELFEILDPMGRAGIMTLLLEHYKTRGLPRRLVHVDGIPVRQELLQSLLTELCLWQQQKGPVNDRPSISATSYMILRSLKEFEQISDGANSRAQQRAAKKITKYATLWDLAMQAMTEVDSDFANKVTAVAVTYGFQGSPHIDKQNTGPFYGLALGDFPEGQGGIGVELDAFSVAVMNTKGRLGKVDGRYPHWVMPYDATTCRYSLIFYQTMDHYVQPTSAIFVPTS